MDELNSNNQVKEKIANFLILELDQGEELYHLTQQKKFDSIFTHITLKADMSDFRVIDYRQRSKYMNGGCYDFALALNFMYGYDMIMLDYHNHALAYDENMIIYDIHGVTTFEELNREYCPDITNNVDVNTMLNVSIDRWENDYPLLHVVQRVNEAISLVRNNYEQFGGTEE